jgi:hypothetical protein
VSILDDVSHAFLIEVNLYDPRSWKDVAVFGPLGLGLIDIVNYVNMVGCVHPDSLRILSSPGQDKSMTKQ